APALDQQHLAGPHNRPRHWQMRVPRDLATSRIHHVTDLKGRRVGRPVRRLIGRCGLSQHIGEYHARVADGLHYSDATRATTWRSAGTGSRYRSKNSSARALWASWSASSASSAAAIPVASSTPRPHPLDSTSSATEALELTTTGKPARR